MKIPLTAAWDVNGLNQLRIAATHQPQQQVAAVAKQVEGLFMQMMLKSMRQSLPKDDLLGSEQQRLFTSLYDQQICQMAGQPSLGLAALIEKQLQPSPPPRSDVGQRPLPLDQDRLQVQKFTAALQHGISQLSALRGPMAEFIHRLLPHVQGVSHQSGIPQKLLLAQAALESGWGQREILTAQGRPSHNLFGIKADSDWHGPTTAIATTEYQQGTAEKIRANFRVYPSLREALTDYVGLLANNPRYQAVIKAKTPEQGAYALQASGYATDPLYAKKLIAIMRQFEPSLPRSASLSAAFNALF